MVGLGSQISLTISANNISNIIGTNDKGTFPRFCNRHFNIIPSPLLLYPRAKKNCTIATFAVEISIVFNSTHQRISISREYLSGSSARFNSCLWSRNKCKIDADFRAERSRAKLIFRAVCTHYTFQSCLYTLHTLTLTPILRKFPDVYSLIYNFSATQSTCDFMYFVMPEASRGPL